MFEFGIAHIRARKVSAQHLRISQIDRIQRRPGNFRVRKHRIFKRAVRKVGEPQIRRREIRPRGVSGNQYRMCQLDAIENRGAQQRFAQIRSPQVRFG